VKRIIRPIRTDDHQPGLASVRSPAANPSTCSIAAGRLSRRLPYSGHFPKGLLKHKRRDVLSGYPWLICADTLAASGLATCAVSLQPLTQEQRLANRHKGRAFICAFIGFYRVYADGQAKLINQI
jgi:hypothetical protein